MSFLCLLLGTILLVEFVPDVAQQVGERRCLFLDEWSIRVGGEGEGKGERKHRYVSGTCVCDGGILLPGAFLVSYFLSSK
jgi:hypothetical protein